MSEITPLHSSLGNKSETPLKKEKKKYNSNSRSSSWNFFVGDHPQMGGTLSEGFLILPLVVVYEAFETGLGGRSWMAADAFPYFCRVF